MRQMREDAGGDEDHQARNARDQGRKQRDAPDGKVDDDSDDQRPPDEHWRKDHDIGCVSGTFQPEQTSDLAFHGSPRRRFIS